MTAANSAIDETAPPRARQIGAAISAWVPAAALLVLRWWWSDRLPDQVASHWSGLGRPDGFSGTWSSWWVIFAICLAAGLVATVALLVLRHSPAAWRGLAGLAVFVASMLATAWAIGGIATLDGGSPQAARLGWRVALIAAPLGYGAFVWLLIGRTARTPTTPTQPTASMPLAPGEQAAWSQSLRSTMFLWLAALLAAGAITFGIARQAQAAVPLAIGAVVVAAFASIRCTIDRRGLRVCVFDRIPIKRIRLDQVADASAEHIDPTRWGGWGYRVMPGRSALVLRAGPGLVVDMTDGRKFAVTLSDPDTPAALLNGLRARAAG